MPPHHPPHSTSSSSSSSLSSQLLFFQNQLSITYTPTTFDLSSSMDIRKLVNTRAAPAQCAPMDVVGHNECQWHHHHTLPPVSSILPDHAYNNNATTGHHYPIPPQGEGNVYYQQVYQQQPQQQQQQTYFAPQQQQQVYQSAPAPPSYQPQDLPYLINNPTARGSSSTLSSTRYAPSSTGSGPATSAERRSLSDGEDDHEDDSDENVSGGSGDSTPLPPYYASNQHQQVCFADGSVTPPESRPGSEGTNEFVCDVCTVSYSRAPDLRRHKASVHNDRVSGEKVSATFPCDVCGQVLLSSHGYQGHMRRHYDERPFVCEAAFCGKAFHDSATLARHRRTHSTEHKFECDFCGRRFKRKDNLNTHRKKHQVGGETINPNLLRKPVSRVTGGNGGGSVGDSPIEGTPASQGYPELPTPNVASPPYQQIQVAPPPSQMQQQPSPPTLNIIPNYTSLPLPIQQQPQQQLRSAFPPQQQQPQQPMYMQQQQQAPMMQQQPQQQQQQHYPIQTQAPPYHAISLQQPHYQHQQQQQQPSPYLYQQSHIQDPRAGQYGVKAEEMMAAAAVNSSMGDGRARVYAISAPRH
ncbi:hypothetical protein FRB95_010319 [Tulasnella sp. JGI-2019a]|nr:hypothetical protein FRB95_010319 [Tulasnella sp. JGI-2019a]